MQARIEEIELEALQAQVRLAEEIEEVRRSFRAELAVPYRGSGPSSCGRPTLARRSSDHRRVRSQEMPDREPMSPNGTPPAAPSRPSPRRSRARSSASGATSPRSPSRASSTR